LYTLGLVIVFLGFYPDPVLDTINISINNLIDNYNKDLIYHLIN